jgi:hypothetical protein
VLIVIQDGEIIDNTGLVSFLRTEQDGIAYWLAHRQPQLFPDLDPGAVSYRWVDDDTHLAREMIRCRGRAAIGDDGAINVTEPPPDPVDIAALRQQLGALVNERAAAAELGEETTDIQAAIDDIRAQILSA